MLDAEARVRGEVAYAVDLELPDMLVAAVLRSPIPHGRIVELEASEAISLPGVDAVLTAADFDRPGGPSLLYGAIIPDQPVVAKDRVRYVGEPVAVVAAVDHAAAQAALAAIQVEYEEEPATYDPLQAMNSGAPAIHADHPDNLFVHGKLRHGDVDRGFGEADEVIEETYTSPLAQQASLEPHTAVARWQADRLTIWTGAQAPYTVRGALQRIFGVQPEDVRVIVPPLGGGFGGKGHVRIEPLVAAVARKTGGRPVKLSLSRAEEFATVTKHPVVIKIKTGFRRDGSLTARQVTLYWGGGAYADASPGLIRASVPRAVGPYRISAVQVDAFGVYTNLPPSAAYRGAMSSQTTWAYESHMDSIAARLGIDPLEFRERNMLHSGESFCTGETMHDVHFSECLRAAAAGLGWDRPKTRDSGRLCRGRGLAVMMKSTIPRSVSECRLALDADGVLTLYTSTVEMGQGAHTALAQIASEAVGVELEKVRIVGPDTAVTPYDATTSASRSTSMMGGAILDAAERLKDRLREAAAPIVEVEPTALVIAGGEIYDPASAEDRLSYAETLERSDLKSIEVAGKHSSQGGLDPETGQGVATPHWHQGAGACEVEVDIETGKVRVLRYHSASFAGRVVNPSLARLQNDGNVIFGMGPALLEEMAFDQGQPVNPNLSDYMLPSILDAPEELGSELLESEAAEFHGIGEMTLPPVAPAIANAVFDAVGVRIRDLPITSERVLRAIKGGPSG